MVAIEYPADGPKKYRVFGLSFDAMITWDESVSMVRSEVTKYRSGSWQTGRAWSRDQDSNRGDR